MLELRERSRAEMLTLEWRLKLLEIGEGCRRDRGGGRCKRFKRMYRRY